MQVFSLVKKAGRGALIIKKDLKDAFRLVPVAHSQRWLLGFEWEGQHYTENCLSFGLRTAPFLFNLFAEGLHWILQSWLGWDLLAHYLDDFIYILPPQWDPTAAIETANKGYIGVATALGLLRNDSKDASGTTVETLGIEIDTTQMTARLSKKKLQKALRLTTSALQANVLTELDAQKLSGFLSFCSSVVILGRTFLRRLWDYTYTFHNPRSLRPLTDGAKTDLLWWKELLPRFNGIHLFDDTSRRSFHLFTDASSHGMGAFWYEGNAAQGDWRQFSHGIPQQHAFARDLTDEETSLHINTTEILIIQLALQRWASCWQSGLLIIHTDNTTAQSAFGRGTTRSAAMDTLRTSLVLATAEDIKLHPQRVSTADNSLADALSRLDWDTVADLTSNWQIPFRTSRHQSSYVG